METAANMLIFWGKAVYKHSYEEKNYQQAFGLGANGVVPDPPRGDAGKVIDDFFWIIEDHEEIVNVLADLARTADKNYKRIVGQNREDCSVFGWPRSPFKGKNRLWSLRHSIKGYQNNWEVAWDAADQRFERDVTDAKLTSER